MSTAEEHIYMSYRALNRADQAHIKIIIYLTPPKGPYKSYAPRL